MEFRKWLEENTEMIRLYRSHPQGLPITPPPRLPSQEVDTPFGKMSLPADNTRGRWFHWDLDLVRHKFGENRPIYYVDLPREEALKYVATSGTPGSYVLPDEYVANAKLFEEK